MFNTKRQHLIPEIIKNHASALLVEAKGRNAVSEQESRAQTLEAVIEYCSEVLNTYRNKTRFKNKKGV